MPGIFGFVQTPIAADASERLTAMVRHAHREPWYPPETLVVEPEQGLAWAGLALDAEGAQTRVYRHPQEPIWALIDGEIYDPDEARSILSQRGQTLETNEPAEILARAYLAGGPEVLSDLHGRFSGVVWDGRSRRLILVTDRFGMRPFYLTQRPDRLLFGSEIKALLADEHVSRTIDPAGLAQFFSFGHLLGTSTLFRDIHALPAAAYYTYEVDSGRLSIDRYARFHAPAIDPNLSDADHLDRIDAAFVRAMRRSGSTSRSLGVSLSGGMDSRMLLATLDPSVRPLTAVSLGIPGSLDHDCAARLAELVGCNYHAHHLNEEFLQDYEHYMRTMVRLTDGHYICQGIVMPTLATYRALGIEVLLRGHAGELMHMQKAYSHSIDASAEAIVDGPSLEAWLFRRTRAYMLESVGASWLAGPSMDEMDQLARESLATSLATLDNQGPAIHGIWLAFLQEHLRRETAMSLQEFNSVTEVRVPLLDRELVDALMSAPPHLKLGETIQAELLRRHRPEFLRVVNANTGVSIGSGALRRKLGTLRLAVLRKLGVPGYQHYEKLGLWLRRELRGFVESVLLGPACLDRGVYQADGIRRIVGEHFDGTRNHTFLLLGLIVFELGQQELLDRTDASTSTASDAELAGSRS